MAIRQSELVALWGLSKSWVSQMVKAGMPLASVEEAEAWRVAHYGAAASRGKRNGSLKLDSVGNGIDDLPSKPEPVRDADLKREDFIGALARLKRNELIAWEMLESAVVVRNENEILIRQRHFRDAMALRVAQEGKVDEILMRRRELVAMAEVEELFGRHLQALRMALKNLPTRMAARCNPSDPTLAKQVLNEAIANVFKTLHKWEV